MDSLTLLNLEKIKKEIWVINKKKIPELQAQVNLISGDDASELVQNLNRQQEALDMLSTRLANLSTKQTEDENKIEVAEGKIVNLEGSIGDLSLAIDDINADLSTLSSIVEGQGSQITSNSQDITSLQNQINSLSVSITNNTNLLSNLSERIDNLENDNSNNKQSISELNTKFETLQSQQTTTDATANEALALAQSLEQEMGNISTGDGSTGAGSSLSGAQIDVLYECTNSDESINLGYKTGLRYMQEAEIDYSCYRYIRVYIIFGGSNEFQIEINVQNKRGLVYPVCTWTGTKYISALRLRLPVNKDKIYIDNVCRFILDGETVPAYEVTDSIKNSFYIYRIDGIDKIE